MDATHLYQKRITGRKLLLAVSIAFGALAFVVHSPIAVAGCLVIVAYVTFLFARYHIKLNSAARLVKQEASLNNPVHLIPLYIGNILLAFGMERKPFVSIPLCVGLSIIYLLLFQYLRNKGTTAEF